MLHKVSDVSSQFFNLFLEETVEESIVGDTRVHPMLQIPTTQKTMVRYYKRSGESSVEDLKEYYPCIVIQDFKPKVNKEIVFGKDWMEGVIDTIKKQVEIVYLPVPMIFRYQVSSITGRRKDDEVIYDWFLSKFSFNVPASFEFNKFTTQDYGYVADFVPYKCSFSEIPREDGRFESVYDFELKLFLHAKSKKATFVQGVGFSGGNFGDYLDKIDLVLYSNAISNVENLLRLVDFGEDVEIR